VDDCIESKEHLCLRGQATGQERAVTESRAILSVSSMGMRRLGRGGKELLQKRVA